MTAIEAFGMKATFIRAQVPDRNLILILGLIRWRINDSDYFTGFLITLLLSVILLQLWMVIRNKRKKEMQVSNLRFQMTVLEDANKELSSQNDWLMTEMHHRVKNNLQIVSSLINNQLSFAKDAVSRAALNASKHRLYVLSLVHQKLFQDASVSTIELSDCIKDLVAYLRDEFPSDRRIDFDISLISLMVDMSFAIPIELIINELLTNTLEYAFPENSRARVAISLCSFEDGAYELVYTDNGVGLPDNFDFLTGKSMGRNLIIGLSQQINARLSIDNNRGVKVKLNFKVPLSQNDPFAVSRRRINLTI